MHVLMTNESDVREVTHNGLDADNMCLQSVRLSRSHSA